MANTSRQYQANWDYDRHGTDFNATVGHILIEGVDWSKAKVEKKAPIGVSGDPLAGDCNAHTNTFSAQPGDIFKDDSRGMIYVTRSGEPLSDVTPVHTTRKFTNQAMASLEKKLSEHRRGTPYSERSMNLWKTVNSGCMPDYSATPVASTADHYPFDCAINGRPDKRLHLLKTDYTEYVEAAMKIKNQFKGGKK